MMESTRGAMRVKPKIDIQRRQIAEYAGVTPALVSYYFPDKALLLEVAAQPVVATYASDVRLILQSKATSEDKLTRLVMLFFVFNIGQGFVLDHYFAVSYAKRRDSKLALLSAVNRELSAFFEVLINLGLVKGDNPQFLCAALWGLCRHLWRRWEADIFQIEESLQGSPGDLARKVLTLISACSAPPEICARRSLRRVSTAK